MMAERLSTSPSNLEKVLNSYSANLNDATVKTDLSKGTISGEVTIDRYTITLAVLFMVQLVFCFCIVGYTNNRVRDAELRNEKQKAEFYKFIYQFNK